MAESSASLFQRTSAWSEEGTRGPTDVPPSSHSGRSQPGRRAWWIFLTFLVPIAFLCGAASGAVLGLHYGGLVWENARDRSELAGSEIFKHEYEQSDRGERLNNRALVSWAGRERGPEVAGEKSVAVISNSETADEGMKGQDSKEQGGKKMEKPLADFRSGKDQDVEAQGAGTLSIPYGNAVVDQPSTPLSDGKGPESIHAGVNQITFSQWGSASKVHQDEKSTLTTADDNAHKLDPTEKMQTAVDAKPSIDPRVFQDLVYPVSNGSVQSDIWHELSDQELFGLAATMPREPSGSDSAGGLKMRKLAFLFLTRGPLPLADLWNRFLFRHRGNFSIYIHTKPGFVYNRFLPQAFKRRQIPSQEVTWGTISVVDAERRLLANALLDPHNDRFILVSESCIPLYNFTFIYNFFMGTNLSFLGAVDDKGPYGRGRYNNFFLPEVEIGQWRKGSQWFELTRELALASVGDTKYYPKFKKFCTGNCYNDEHYLPTMLSILYPNKLANRSTTYVDWSRGGFHPHTFEAHDISKATIGKMRQVDETCLWTLDANSACTLFARKVSPSSLINLVRLHLYLRQ